MYSITLFDCINQHFLELLQVDVLHDEDFVFFFQLLVAVQHHHASSVDPLQLHRHCNLNE